MAILMRFLLMTLTFHLGKSLIELQLNTHQCHLTSSNLAFDKSSSNALDESYLDHISDSGNVTISIKMGTPPKDFKLLLDIAPYLTWIPDNSNNHYYPFSHPFISTESETFSPLGTPFDLGPFGQVRGKLSSDVIEINNKKARFTWGYASESKADIKADGVLSLGYQYSSPFDKSLSLMARLMEDKLISRNVFSIYLRHSSPLTSRLYIGDLHDDFKVINRTGSCKLNQTTPYWSCNLTHVFISKFTSKSFQSSAKAENISIRFSTTARFILLPSSFIDFFERNITHTDKRCSSYCYFTVSSRWDNPPIYFVLNNTAYRIDPNELYTERGDEYIMNINFSDMSPPVLGTPFLNSVHIAFDADNHQVHLAVLNSLDIVNQVSNGESGGKEDPQEKGGNNTGLIVGVIVGVLTVLIAGVLIYRYVNKRSQQIAPSAIMTEGQLLSPNHN